MRNISVLGAVIALVVLTGCAGKYSDVPTPTRYEKSGQQKLMAADHWRLIADDFAQQISADLKQKNAGQALYIIPAGKSGDFDFVEGFRELLTTTLVNQGWVVRTVPQNALQMDIRYSAYKFNPNRRENTRHYGKRTTLAAGVWALHDLFEHTSDSFDSVMPKVSAVAVVADVAEWLAFESGPNPLAQNASGRIPSTEILLTAHITYDDQIVARRSSIYYVADEDSAIYWEKHGGEGEVHEVRVKGEE
jgi:hypothetical protein